MDVKFIKSAFQEAHYLPPDRPEVAFAGRSNVGKSSLINVLVNRKKMARISSTPGRTQAINFFEVDHNESLYFVDLPGYGFAKVPIAVKKSWGKMVEAYLQKRPNLRGVVVILDIRREPGPGDMDLLSWLEYFHIPAIIILTKSDKISKQKVRSRAASIKKMLGGLCKEEPILFSAKTRNGREDIWHRIHSVTGNP